MKSQYTIGEIAKIYRISTDSLRLYEKMGLIQPERGDNAYRYYSIFDIWKLNVIQTMKSLGVQLKDIKTFLDDRSVEGEIDLLEKEHLFLTEDIKKRIYRRDHIKNRIELLKEANNFKGDYHIYYKTLPERRVAYIQTQITLDDEVDLAYTKLLNDNDQEITFLNRDFGTFLDVDKAKCGEFNDYTKAFLILDEHIPDCDGIICGGEYLILRYRGPYTNAKDAYGILLNEIDTKNLNTDGAFIERFIIDINLTDREEEYLTEIQIRLLA